jgi:asparagine synthase (glutamine-hydrolysing)
MAAGLEERVPILDYRLVELANRIPTSWKLSLWQKPDNWQGKMIWKKAIGKYLLPHVLAERKRGWFTPMAKWLRADLRDFVSEQFSPANLQTDYFNAAGVQKIWQDHLSGQRYNLNIIWAIVMWQLWYKQFIKK